MDVEFDAAKDAANRQKHGLALADAARLDWTTAMIEADNRFNYGEARFRAWGMLDGLLHVVAFTMRGEVYRIISFRKANRTEAKRYG